MKALLIFIIVILLSGCTDESFKEEKSIYNSYIDEVKVMDIASNDEYIPFDINLYYDKIIETEVMYRIIIDNPKIPVREIEAIVIHDQKTTDIFPTSGIFDQKYSLIPGVINRKSNYVEGIILIGYIPFDDEISKLKTEFKVLIKYTDDFEKEHKVFYSSKTDNLVGIID